MNAERSAAGMGAAVPGLSTKKNSQGFDIMPDEVEEFCCEYKATGSLTDGFITRLIKKIKYYMTCQCMCQCIIPEHSQSVQVLVTNKRVVLREKKLRREPGIKKCCYYVSGMCCCPNNVDEGIEKQFCIERKDIKDYTFCITHKDSELMCMCCLISKKVDEGFDTKIYCTRTIAETRAGWMDWSLDKDTKTYAAVMKFDGKMAKADCEKFRQMLHAIVAQNEAAAERLAVLQKEGKADPLRLNVTLGGGGEGAAGPLPGAPGGGFVSGVMNKILGK